MAGFGWNMRQGNMHGLQNHAQKSPFSATQIACRVCDQVFFSTQALLNHIETHMANGGDTAAARRQMSTINIGSHVSQERNPFLFSNPRSVLNQWPVPPTSLSLLSRKDLVFGPQLARYNSGQQAVQRQQRSSSDFTKPLIDQLLKTVPGLERGDDKNRVYESDHMLDLTLKL